jgi:hypothetical protein
VCEAQGLEGAHGCHPGKHCRTHEWRYGSMKAWEWDAGQGNPSCRQDRDWQFEDKGCPQVLINQTRVCMQTCRIFSVCVATRRASTTHIATHIATTVSTHAGSGPHHHCLAQAAVPHCLCSRRAAHPAAASLPCTCTHHTRHSRGVSCWQMLCTHHTRHSRGDC